MIDLKKVDTFRAIQIETLHGCNRNCKTCPNSVIPKNRELMSSAIYLKILDSLKKMNFRGRISPYLQNEPTLDERLEDFIKETRKMFPDNVIFIGSNGMAKDIKYYRKLFDAGLTQVLITCYDEVTYEKFKQYENGQEIRLWPVFDKDLNDIFCNRANNVKVGPEILVNKGCSKGLTQAFVNYLGEMILCCADYYYEVVAGNIKDNSIEGLYNSTLLKHYRRHLSMGNRRSLGLCSRCNFLRDR